jgi:hypothetical protein
VSRPGEAHQQPHQPGNRDGKDNVVEESNRKDAEDERSTDIPMPEVLVEQVCHPDENCPECLLSHAPFLTRS